MAEIDRAALQASCAGELDVIGAQHLEHLRTHQAHDERELKERQGRRRHDDVRPALQREQAGLPAAEIDHPAAPEGGQPAEPYAEDQNHENSDDEGGQRDAHQGNGQEHAAQPRVAPKPRVDAHGHADDERDDRRDRDELDGGRQALGEQLVDGLADAVGEPELALQRVARVADELNGDRIVESEPLSQLLALLGGAFRPEHVVDRIADELEQGEADDADDHHDDDRLEESLDDECEHSGSALAAAETTVARSARPGPPVNGPARYFMMT